MGTLPFRVATTWDAETLPFVYRAPSAAPTYLTTRRGLYRCAGCVPPVTTTTTAAGSAPTTCSASATPTTGSLHTSVAGTRFAAWLYAGTRFARRPAANLRHPACSTRSAFHFLTFTTNRFGNSACLAPFTPHYAAPTWRHLLPRIHRPACRICAPPLHSLPYPLLAACLRCRACLLFTTPAAHAGRAIPG